MTINEAITASHHDDQNFRAFLKGDDPEVVAMRKALVQLADAVSGESTFIKLTSPIGPVYLRKDYITSFAELKTVGARSGTATKSQVWMNGQEEPYHVFEDVDTICRLTE